MSCKIYRRKIQLFFKNRKHKTTTAKINPVRDCMLVEKRTVPRLSVTSRYAEDKSKRPACKCKAGALRLRGRRRSLRPARGNCAGFARVEKPAQYDHQG